MRKLLAVLAGTLVLSNVIWAYLYLSQTPPDPKVSDEAEVKLYTLSGSGHRWDITGYKILISPDKIMRGEGKLTYKGEPGELRDSSYFEMTFRESTPAGGMEAVFSNEYRSDNGPVSILPNAERMGRIAGPYSDGEADKTKADYENTVLEVIWEDEQGQIQTEFVELNIDDEVIL
ncbi:hypothetical protein DNH61_02830 [Paenibacillus sambharensis]|uniref:Uncharacterized protein n=1 Tax=Paenibacillus sambharensis TaxID=1803190 RepID=A0A2W1LS39_9BACL|nr:hypothetical protein [Paenibacillus sambharensis]PZD97304.1 hypothetical protein DNH61_02830 [Paenibacillus sambharensis]